MRSVLVTSVLAVAVWTAPVQAQTWSAEQTEVWEVELAVWELDWAGDKSWIAKYVLDDALVWNADRRGPRDKSSIARFYRFEDAGAQYPVHELWPLGIVVHGNVAVVHYRYSAGVVNAKGERKEEHGDFTDVLVKENGRWRFLTWRGGQFKSN